MASVGAVGYAADDGRSTAIVPQRDGEEMAVLDLLSPERHADLPVRRPTAAGRHFVQVVPSEFGRVAARAPILLTKYAETGQFYPGAIFGFVEGENLLVDDAGVLEGHMPVDLERQGFFIAEENIAIDPDHPRFKGGEIPLFEDGQPSDALRRVQRALGLLKAGLDTTEPFIATMLETGLVEPIDISLSFDDGEKIALTGLYTISRDALSELDDAAVLRLFRAGHLQLAQTMIDSLDQIPLLARRRNDRVASFRP
jgi:hypothetical protein